LTAYDACKYTSVPVTETGSIGGKLLGIITSRDADFIQDRTKLVSEIMVPVSKLVCGKQGITLEEANTMIKQSKKGKLPVIDRRGCLTALVSRADILKNREFPLALKETLGDSTPRNRPRIDSQGSASPPTARSPPSPAREGHLRRLQTYQSKSLMVGAAVGTSLEERPRVDALCSAGCNVILIDSKQGDSVQQAEMIRYIKTRYPQMEVIGGNAVTSTQVMHLIEAGVDAVRVGMGAGSVSTSQLIKAVGRAQCSAIFHTARTCNRYGIPVIADGGLTSSGSVMKALAMGASTVMMGSLLAGTDESPGDFFFQDGKRVKQIHGTQSRQALGENRTLYTGVSGMVVDNGSVHAFLPYMCQSLRHGFQDAGSRSLLDMHRALAVGELRFELRSQGAQREGGVHDLHSYTRNTMR